MLNPFRKFAAAIALFPALCWAQNAVTPSLTQVPTTHILAIGRFVRPLTAAERRSIMPREVPDTLRLILDGKIDQGWVRKDGRGVVFLMNLTTVDEAHAVLEKLPLGKAKLMEFEYMPLGPLGPLRILLDNNSTAAR